MPFNRAFAVAFTLATAAWIGMRHEIVFPGPCTIDYRNVALGAAAVCLLSSLKVGHSRYLRPIEAWFRWWRAVVAALLLTALIAWSVNADYEPLLSFRPTQVRELVTYALISTYLAVLTRAITQPMRDVRQDEHA